MVRRLVIAEYEDVDYRDKVNEILKKNSCKTTSLRDEYKIQIYVKYIDLKNAYNLAFDGNDNTYFTDSSKNNWTQLYGLPYVVLVLNKNHNMRRQELSEILMKLTDNKINYMVLFFTTYQISVEEHEFEKALTIMKNNKMHRGPLVHPSFRDINNKETLTDDDYRWDYDKQPANKP
jgi:hypothetical protein